MKKIIFGILILVFAFSSFNFALAQRKIEVNFFYSLTCPYCAKEKKFLEKLEKKYPEIEIKEFGIFERKNVELLKEFYQNYLVPPEMQGGVPATFIKDQYFFGFNERIGQDIENYILKLIEEIPPEPTKPEKRVFFPIIGEIDISKFSLLALSVILGFFDGLNVCSLGALVLILGLVLAFKSKIKTLILGGIFILTTGIVYGILIFLWHKLFLALSPYLKNMEIVIGILALAGGIYFLREFLKFKKRGPVCEFGGISEKLSQKIKKIFEKRVSILALILVIFSFAAIVTIVEFPCSAVIPVLFAGILAEANLSTLLSLLYISIFLLFYILDEIIVFLIAVFTMRIWITSPKFITWLNFAASIIFFFLGAYYLLGLI